MDLGQYEERLDGKKYVGGRNPPNYRVQQAISENSEGGGIEEFNA